MMKIAPSKVTTPKTPPGFPGVSLTSSKCARPSSNIKTVHLSFVVYLTSLARIQKVNNICEWGTSHSQIVKRLEAIYFRAGLG